MITTGDDQANVEPPLEIGTRINTVDVRIRKEPRKSTFWSFDLKDPVTGLSGRNKIIWMSDRALTGTVTQKTHLHCILDDTEIDGEYRNLLSEDSAEERSDRGACSHTDADKCHHLA